MIKRLTLGLLATALLLAAAPDAEAHRKRSKIRDPIFGGWTYGPDLPHSHPKKVNKRTPATVKTYYFRVYNVDSTDTISYYYRGTRYYLRPGYNRKHRTTSRFVTLEMDYTASNNRWDGFKVNLDTDLKDLRVWRKGRYLRFTRIND